jgi:transposase
VLADRGYFDSEEIRSCEAAGAIPHVPKPLTSGAKAKGRFGKQDFVYDPKDDVYRCPAGERLTRRFAAIEDGLRIHKDWSSNCGGCRLKARCTPSKQRPVSRCEHEAVIEAMQDRLDRHPRPCASEWPPSSTRSAP